MNPVVKQKWIEALLSGEYIQGKEVLKREDNKFCCLGVLCDIHAKETGAKWYPTATTVKLEHIISCGDYLGSVKVLPIQVIEWAGLNSENPLVADNYLASRNDTGETFEEIAKLIEEHL